MAAFVSSMIILFIGVAICMYVGGRRPIGTPVTIEVAVVRVGGEQKTDNNRQSYTAIFTR